MQKYRKREKNNLLAEKRKLEKFDLIDTAQQKNIFEVEASVCFWERRDWVFPENNYKIRLMLLYFIEILKR